MLIAIQYIEADIGVRSAGGRLGGCLSRNKALLDKESADAVLKQFPSFRGVGPVKLFVTEWKCSMTVEVAGTWRHFLFHLPSVVSAIQSTSASNYYLAIVRSELDCCFGTIAGAFERTDTLVCTDGEASLGRATRARVEIVRVFLIPAL